MTPSPTIAEAAAEGEWVTIDDVFNAHAQFGQLDWHLVKKAMGPNWPKMFEDSGPGEGIFHSEEQRT